MRHAIPRASYNPILRRRRDSIIPLIGRIPACGTYEVRAASAVSVLWKLDGGGVLRLDANLSDRKVSFPAITGDVLWLDGAIGAEAGGLTGLVAQAAKSVASATTDTNLCIKSVPSIGKGISLCAH